MYDIEGLSPTVHTCGGGNLEPKIIETPAITASNDISDAAVTVQKESNIAAGNAVLSGAKKNCSLGKCRIRKLTPKECLRLMGFDDGDIEKAQKINSNSQLYKQAGNSIVVNVLYHIFENLFWDYIAVEEISASEPFERLLPDLSALARFRLMSKTAR